MKNFKITPEGALQVRPGTQTVAEVGTGAIKGLWTGYIDGTEVMVAACDDNVWAIDIETETATEIGAYDTTNNVCFFGYDEKLYMLNGSQYCSWDGTTFAEVAGYIPLIQTATVPTGGGTALEAINMLNPKRKVWFSPDVDGTKTYQLPETGLTSIDYVKNLVTGTNYTLTTDYTVSTANGTVTFVSAPTTGVNTIEICYTANEDLRSEIESMRYAELYNGTTDNRVFLYGDGTNKTYYSDLDYNGMATAEYFPPLNVLHAGDSNTPITALIRHYNRLLAFKEDSAYNIYYDSITLADNSVTAGFFISTVNKMLGNTALGQAQLVLNYPYTLDGKSIYEWKATTTSGNITGDQRNAKRVSEKVEKTLSEFVLSDAVTYVDKYNHEYYVVYNGTAVIYNYGNDTWYTYTNFPATCFTMLDGELYIGTSAGNVMHVSRQWRSDDGEDIPAKWVSGYMDFGADYKRKYSAMLWVGMLPESGGEVYVTLNTDNKSNFSELVITRSIATFAHVNYANFSFNTNRRPTMKRLKLKAKKFIYYQMILTAGDSTKTATITSADIRVRYTGNVR
jgi:hypothetical protein